MLNRVAPINHKIAFFSFVGVLVAATALLASAQLSWSKPKLKVLDAPEGIWKIEQMEDGTFEGVLEVEVDNLDPEALYSIKVEVLELGLLPSECRALALTSQAIPPGCQCQPLGGLLPGKLPPPGECPPGISQLEVGPLVLDAPPHGKAKGKRKANKGAAKQILTDQEKTSWGEIKFSVE